MDSVTLSERLFAPSVNECSSENVSVKLSTKHFSMLIRALKLQKIMWQKEGDNQGTFRIAKNMQLIVINHKLTMTLMQLIAIKYLNCLTALIYIYMNHHTSRGLWKILVNVDDVKY